MNPLRVLSLTILMLMLASRLPGQFPSPPPPLQGVQIYGLPVVCNDGTILFSVARAYREANTFSADAWEIEGWYNVDPGKCEKIGQSRIYYNGGWFGKDSVTLLAFAFRDSIGTWGSIKLQGGDNRLWHPSNQQFCVNPEGFGYVRDSSGGDLPRACDGKQTGYQMIPAAYEYSGPEDTYGGQDELHVKLDSSDRAIPLGKQSPSGGIAPKNTAAPGGASNQPISTVDADAQKAKDGMLQAVREDVAAYIEASKTGFEAYKKGEAQMSQGYRRWDSNVKPLLANGCWVFQGATGANFNCVIPVNPDLNRARSFYTQISEDVTASLPRDWSPDAVPPFGGDLPSKGYRSSSGARGEVWLTHAESDGGYELHFELDAPSLPRGQQ